MHPLAELTLTRPWHWGVAVIGDPLADLPSPAPGRSSVAGDGVVAIGVRHAQDIDADRYDGDWEWATATIYVRSLGGVPTIERQVLCDAVIATRDEALSLGDADGMVVIPAPGLQTRVVVTADEPDPTGLEQVWVDLIAADG